MSCPICWEDINNNSFTTICDHQFHKNCLERWLFNHQTCPMWEILYIKPVDKNIIDDSVYWSYEDIAVGFTKLHNTFLVEPVVKIIDAKEYFHYKSATVLLESSLESFLDCIDDGVIRYDHRWSVDHRGPHAGKEHNHGGGFRLINKGDWMKLASSKITLD